jgi:hypothetical protein
MTSQLLDIKILAGAFLSQNLFPDKPISKSDQPVNLLGGVQWFTKP